MDKKDINEGLDVSRVETALANSDSGRSEATTSAVDQLEFEFKSYFILIQRRALKKVSQNSKPIFKLEKFTRGPMDDQNLADDDDSDAYNNDEPRYNVHRMLLFDFVQ